MTSKRAPTGGDNFRLIRGISRSIERRLHEEGILTYANLASLKPQGISAILGDLNGLTPERIIKENWLEQARSLSSRQGSTKPEKKAVGQDNLAPAKSKGPTSFVVELLLNEEGQTKRTKVLHVDTGGEETWEGWQEHRLLDFIVTRAELCDTAAAIGMPTGTTVEHRPEAEVSPETIPADIIIPGLTTSSEPQISAQPQAIEIAISTGRSAFQKTKATPAKAKAGSGVLSANQAFELHLALDRSEIASLKGRPLNFTANIYAKSLKGHLRQSVGEAGGQLDPTGTATIIIDGNPMPQGLYRLQAVVGLSDPTSQSKQQASSIFQTGEKLLRIV
jgi:predicted flap endonuclease-1-like 5' DNA nuclease